MGLLSRIITTMTTTDTTQGPPVRRRALPRPAGSTGPTDRGDTAILPSLDRAETARLVLADIDHRALLALLALLTTIITNQNLSPALLALTTFPTNQDLSPGPPGLLVPMSGDLDLGRSLDRRSRDLGMDRDMSLYTDIHLATGILGMGPGQDLGGEKERGF
ncbi:hypothetical protein BDW72DRAFT_33879 [Aspergillus terricola var. indicus]